MRGLLSAVINLKVALVLSTNLLLFNQIVNQLEDYFVIENFKIRTRVRDEGNYPENH